MTTPVTHLDALLRTMEPALNPGVYAYCVVSPDTDPTPWRPVVTVVEREGLTLVLLEEQALALGLRVLFRAAWITLTVHSDLQAVGLTAAFAGALGRAGVSCNVVAGAYHDHVFVPAEQASLAMDALRALQQASQQTPSP